MNIQRIMMIVDASYHTRRTIEHSLREIDRRALNAMVLVKRHGKALAGYGVVAQAFRERAANLKEAASHLQESIAPLIQAHMCILQHRSYADLFHRKMQEMYHYDIICPTFVRTEKTWERVIIAEEAVALTILRQLIKNVEKLQEGIAEQEYVVIIGRIEAALSEGTGAPLMRVSRDMGMAVATVRDAIWKYHNQLEEILHESNIGI
ncbi:hypothetical protein [Acidithiobacillus ferriphilus]|uniref:hypothetical protein n=1 Tax=Acidithiobacillus ferriphilus TaxID=1689834 RepID=UPI001C071479|nr:hypothetical protein [Acidithiobacillus ferriphilus]MBU2829189.1 hypothetical protein [Acidithiobacillus ferriphilus]